MNFNRYLYHVTLHQYGIYLSEVSKISHFQVLTMGVFFAVNYSSLKPRILLLSGICGSGRSHWLVGIPLQEGGLFIIPFLATIRSLVSEEGLRCVSLFLAENMPLKSVCFWEQSSLTALLFGECLNISGVNMEKL